VRWFRDHYEDAPAQIAEFCAAQGVRLAGRRLADIGCGDGVMSVGMVHRTQPASLVGFDIVPVDVPLLLQRCGARGVLEGTLPPELEFRPSEPLRLPADDGEFDFVYSWSAFEHIEDPRSVLTEIRRVLRPGGHFFLQLWPFYLSAKGSHLWDWFDEDFHHLLEDEAAIVAKLEASDRHAADWTAYMSREFQHLNRLTLAQLQEHVQAAGLTPRVLELITLPTRLDPRLAHYSWADLAISGIKLLATPDA
jgi:ubiquinone/menaquinone biosynthesis C-methylase UbiE